MARTYHWGILGCGKIARKFSKDLQSLDNAHCYAVASRELAKAQDFADTFCFEKAYGTYLELVEDPAVDIVYIATPHAFHLAHSLLCLEHRKAVLCEKAFAMNHREVQQMVRASKESNTFLMEAFWTRFQPQFLKVLELIKTQPLGALRFVKSDFMFNGPYDPENRLYNIGLGGGSLLDIGIYPVFYALMFLGKPDHIKTLPHFSPTGSEESIAVLFGYN
ncbi:MAG: Gfo/Idh/MocA family oxidoreductase, partial [Lutibacter sp.]|nr:Gfo/Idh/MocA family oxidoreductase [Lutibacter sp.]